MTDQATIEDVRTFEQPDGYVTHYRLWGSAQGEDVVVMLHGGMSHSGWQEPLGSRLAQRPGTSFIAADLRGSGLNDKRGHIPSGELAVADIAGLLRHLKASYGRIHLAGWCFGAQVATVAAARLADEQVLSSLIMTSPGFFFHDWYMEVLDRSVEAALAAVEELGVKPEPERAFIAVPLRPTDFTDRPEWHKYIEEDSLKLVLVTEGTVDSWEEIAVRSEKDFFELGPIPVLAVFGKHDKLVDNDQVREFLAGRPHVEVHELDTGHALLFEDTDTLTALVSGFIEHVSEQTAPAAAPLPRG